MRGVVILNKVVSMRRWDVWLAVRALVGIWMILAVALCSDGPPMAAIWARYLLRGVWPTDSARSICDRGCE